MDLQLKGKVVLVSGGGAGIGSGIVVSLVKEGAVPIILTRSDKPEFKKELDAMGADYEFHLIDLNNTDQIKPIVDDVAKRRGGIYGVVNNAGCNDNKEFFTYPRYSPGWQ